MYVYGMEMNKMVQPKPTREAVGKWYEADEALRVIRTTHKNFLYNLLKVI